MKKIYLGIMLCGMIIFQISAASAAGLRIDKPKIRLIVPAGSYDGGQIAVENTGSEPTGVRVYLQDWVYSASDGGKEFMPKATLKNSASGWITFNPADLNIPAKGKAFVNYSVQVPKGASGGRYAVMFFEVLGTEVERFDAAKGQNVHVQILNRLGALFYIEPKGTIEKKGRVDNVDILQKLNDFILTADFINSGNVDITTQGAFDVIDSQGYVYLRGRFDEIYTLSGDKAELKGVVDGVQLKPGSYDIIMTFDFENGGNLIQEVSILVDPTGQVSLISTQES